jgi:hypothetical protein
VTGCAVMSTWRVTRTSQRGECCWPQTGDLLLEGDRSDHRTGVDHRPVSCQTAWLQACKVARAGYYPINHPVVRDELLGQAPNWLARVSRPSPSPALPAESLRAIIAPRTPENNCIAQIETGVNPLPLELHPTNTCLRVPSIMRCHRDHYSSSGVADALAPTRILMA